MQDLALKEQQERLQNAAGIAETLKRQHKVVAQEGLARVRMSGSAALLSAASYPIPLFCLLLGHQWPHRQSSSILPPLLAQDLFLSLALHSTSACTTRCLACVSLG